MKMKKTSWLCAALITAGALGYSVKTEARVIVKEQVTFYNVTGRTGKEIFKSMIANGPKVGRRNDHALATTEYKYDIKNISVEVSNGRCVPTKLEVHMKVKYTYPKWSRTGGASKQTRAAWNNFKKTVVWHEEQHVRIAKELAEEYERALKKTRFRFKKECNPKSVSFNWRVNLANMKNNRNQKKFDRKDLRPGGRGYEAQLRLLQSE